MIWTSGQKMVSFCKHSAVTHKKVHLYADIKFLKHLCIMQLVCDCATIANSALRGGPICVIWTSGQKMVSFCKHSAVTHKKVHLLHAHSP